MGSRGHQGGDKRGLRAPRESQAVLCEKQGSPAPAQSGTGRGACLVTELVSPTVQTQAVTL